MQTRPGEGGVSRRDLLLGGHRPDGYGCFWAPGSCPNGGPRLPGGRDPALRGGPGEVGNRAWPGVDVRGFSSPAVCSGADQNTQGTEGHRRTDSPSERGPAGAKEPAGAGFPVTLGHPRGRCQPGGLDGTLSPGVCSTHPEPPAQARDPLGRRLAAPHEPPPARRAWPRTLSRCPPPASLLKHHNRSGRMCTCDRTQGSTAALPGRVAESARAALLTGH